MLIEALSEFVKQVGKQTYRVLSNSDKEPSVERSGLIVIEPDADGELIDLEMSSEMTEEGEVVEVYFCERSDNEVS